MKIMVKFALLVMMMNICCAFQSDMKIEEQVEELRKKLSEETPKPESGRALVYEISRSKDNTKMMGEFFVNKNRDIALLRVYAKGNDKKKFIYLDLSNDISYMLVLHDTMKSGAEMRGIDYLVDLLSPLTLLTGKDVDQVLSLYTELGLYIDGNGINAGVWFSPVKDRLPWEVLAEDISGIEETKNQYKISREKHGGYFTFDKKTGYILEQKETLNGQTKEMKLISHKAWNGEFSKLLPDRNKYNIETVDLDEKLTVEALVVKIVGLILQNKEFAAKIKNDSKKVEHDLRDTYLKMWRQNSNLVKIPGEWERMKMEFLKSVGNWTDEEKLAWKNLAKSEAVKELRVAYFPILGKDKMMQLFEAAVKDVELDKEGKASKDLTLLTLSRATYQAWAEVIIAKYLETL